LSPGRANQVGTGMSPDVGRLSLCQVESALASLSDGEMIALMKIARLYARKTPYDKEDLIQEAFARVLSGRRAWSKGTGPVLFLGGVIRSIAWEWKSEGPLDTVPSTDLKMEERNANAAIDAAKIVALFEDDAIARNMVAAMMGGARGEELQAISGLGKVAYESKRTKIRRRVEKFFDREP
jgi:DNA-directed RNA polymerase specialized sigma24 family protein